MSRKKKYFEYKLGHGWFDGYMKQTDVISTIDSGVANWHILIAEKFDDVNELIERERVPIKNRTKMGFLWAYDKDSIDISPRMVYHRGTVQHGISHTIKTSIDVGVIEIERNRNV